jgi:uncharacterized protein (DUF1501 family)
MTQINRRQFLKNALALSITTATPWQVWASPTGGSDTRMVFIFLRGGYDALNTLVPYSSDFYYEQRPNIAIARPTEEDEHSAIALNDTWGLHPMLAQHLLPLYQAGELAIVPFCGTDFVSRSHFDAQDWIEWGQGRAPTGAETQSGFLNRLLTQLQKGQTNNKGISFTPHLTPIWQGSTAVDNNSLSIKDLKTNLSTDRQTLLQQLYTGHPLARLVTEGLSLQTMLTQEFDEEMIQASRQAVSSNGFAQSAQKVGKLLRDHPNYRLGFMDIGGWDTHVNQGSAQGALANKLQALGEGLVTLKNSLGDQWSKTLVIVMSEFGRTFAENGNKGTDHGHGSVLWLLGGAIQGGIKGEQIQLNRQTLHQARDLPVFNEYRSVLANLFQHSYGLTPTQLAQIFPNVQHQTFNLL